MNLPDKQRRREIENLPSTWSDIDFSNFTVNDKAFWFETRRVEPWLLNDTKRIKEEAQSMFGLIAMVCIGVEFLSKFRYGKDEPNKYFPQFLEEYLDTTFKREVKNTYKPNPPANSWEGWFYRKSKHKYSEIFYFGMRNQLMHRFLFRHSVLIEPRTRFLSWQRREKRLLVDARFLHINFENGVRKYISELWKSKPGEEVYDNFSNTFKENFERKF